MSKTYLFDYYHEGSNYQFELPAESREDAEARLQKLPHARYVGELVAKVPAQLGWVAKAWVWVAPKLEVLRAYSANEEPR